MESLRLIAKQMVAEGKGILAADESTPTCTKRFENLGLESTELNRNEYRSNLFSTENLERYISGVILFDETFHQTLFRTDTSIPEYLKTRGILTGIKVDTGAKKLAGYSSEKITEGLDGLRDRAQTYQKMGASFAKWRAVITIDEDMPSKACIYSNAHALARYASLCQENGLVPIVEPEILMDGTHSMQKCYDVTTETLKSVFEQLNLLKVDLESIVLKPNMVLPGSRSNEQINNETIAKMTFKTLSDCVPTEVPGIAFLSGGQSSDLASERLNTLNRLYIKDRPWKLTFSYGRALQEDALSNWAKKGLLKGNETTEKYRKDSQDALIYRARMNHLASMGEMK